MNATVQLARKLYRDTFPYHRRIQLRGWFFGLLRRTEIFGYLNSLGLSVCQGYISINFTNAETKLVQSIIANKRIEQDALKPSTTLIGEELREMHFASVKTETVLLDIQRSEFSLINNHLLDVNMNVIGGYRTAFDNLPIYYHFLSKPIYLKGMIAYLSDPQPSNYYHWMCGTLPLLRTYQSYLDLDAIDYFYVGQFHLTGFHQESLARIGININRVIQKACTADRMLAAITTRFVQLNDPISREAFFFTRNLFADVVTQHSSSPRTRIYVERGNVSRRRVINEDQILALLKKYDFEPVTMDGKSVSEQAEIFSRAEAIVAPHGAALTNLLFVQPYTTVIELLPEGYINNCFFVLASYAESNYFYLQGESTTTSHLNAHSLDLQIDIQKLEKLCRMAAL